GLVALHLVLQVEFLLAVAWPTMQVVVLGVLGALLAWRLRGRGASARHEPWGWGDAVAVAVLVALPVVCAREAIAHPAFVYDWGAKGRKFAAAAGIDLAFLGPPSGWHLHPDYPNLLPELFALTAGLGGGWSEAPLLLWTAIACGALLLALRD